MNSHERFMAALRLEEPDRVPIYEGYIDQNVVEALCPGGTYHDLIDQLDLDMVRITEGDIRDFLDDQGKTYRDKWGVTFRLASQMSGFPIQGPLSSEEDLSRYTPPDPEDELAYQEIPAVLSRFKGKRTVIWRGHDGFHTAAQLRGMENLLMDLVVNPGFAHAVLEMCNEVHTRVAVEAVKRGCDVVVLLDDYADKRGPLMSPSHFREFVLPCLSKTVQAIKTAGASVIKHTDGKIWSILDDIVGTGVDAINPLEPVAGMDMGEAKRKYGSRVCLVGNIDCGNLLCLGSPEEVRGVVARTIRVAAPGGGYIISSSNSLQAAVNPQNYLAMVEEAKKRGRYPLKLD